MRTKLLAFIGLFLAASSIYLPNASASGALPIRLKFTSTSVTTTAYTQLLALTARGIKGYTVANSGSAPVEIAFGSAGNEVVQTVHPNTTALTPVFYPVSGGYGVRVSVISLDQTNSTGELELNLIYN